ncbi:hypothetical protein PO181_02090 [Leuconostoc suionicum]|uniref:hypothetical protein n=1 Tax=Leuconostoc suionicum TaxID=1511761 RepID=UPI00233F11F5|nr:hypothetical protein [Leuconostoc suionicum]MDC2815793.1 hypothetical protein [Leuconostoc suionicum]
MKQFIHDYLKLPNVQFFLHHWIGCIFLMIILITCYVLVIIVENKQPNYPHSKQAPTKMRPAPSPRINLDRGAPTKPNKQ